MLATLRDISHWKNQELSAIRKDILLETAALSQQYGSSLEAEYNCLIASDVTAGRSALMQRVHETQRLDTGHKPVRMLELKG